MRKDAEKLEATEWLNGHNILYGSDELHTEAHNHYKKTKEAGALEIVLTLKETRRVPAKDLVSLALGRAKYLGLEHFQNLWERWRLDEEESPVPFLRKYDPEHIVVIVLVICGRGGEVFVARTGIFHRRDGKTSVEKQCARLRELGADPLHITEAKHNNASKNRLIANANGARQAL